MEFVAVGLCCSVEEEELRKASLVLEACLTPLCTVLSLLFTASFHKHTQQPGSESRGKAGAGEHAGSEHTWADWRELETF